MELKKGNCIELMKALADESVDAIITDPPYNIGKDFEGEEMGITEWTNWCEEWVKECNRVLIAGGAFYTTLGFQSVAEFKVMLNKFTELRLKNWIVWYRQDGWKGDKGFGQSHEHILYYIKDNTPETTQEEFRAYLNQKRNEKELTLSDINKHFGWASNGGGCASTYMGDKEDNSLPTKNHYQLLKEYLGLDNRFDNLPFGVKFNKTDVSDDVWLTPKSEKDRLGHPTQKPIKLMRRMVLGSTNMGDIVLDPFMGSGTTGIACKETGREFIGFEIDDRYFKIAEKRISEAKKQKRLGLITESV